MINPVSAENEQEWANLCAALWPDGTPEDFIKDRAGGENPHEFLYMAGGRAVAFISLSLRNDYVEGTDARPVGYVEGLFVAPNSRNRGIAKALVKFAGQWASERGCTQLASDCIVTNEAGRAFHNRIGFKEANTIVCFTMDIVSDHCAVETACDRPQ